MFATTSNQTETLSEAVRRLSRAIKDDPLNSQLYFERGLAFFYHENWFNAQDDFQQAVTLAEFPELHEEYKKMEREAAKMIGLHLDTKVLLAPSREKIERLEEDPRLPIEEIAGTYEEKVELIAALAFWEKYEILENLFAKKELSENDDDWLNGRLRSSFAWWEPSPLYFITGEKQWVEMQDPCRMIRFLVDRGADPNLPAGDGSTPLWNQLNSKGSLQILETLLELGADPNQISRDEEYEWLPLVYCLIPFANDEDEDDCLPYDSDQIRKAELLLRYGAEVNNCCPALPPYTPLWMAVAIGRGLENVSLVKMLLERGADVNPAPDEDGSSLLHTALNPLSDDRFGSENKPASLQILELLLQYGANPYLRDDDGDSPLDIATDCDFPEARQLLLSYGAAREEADSDREVAPGESIDHSGEQESPDWKLKATELCFFRPGAGSPWSTPHCFSKDEVLNSASGLFQTSFFKILISEKTAASLKGRVIYDFQNLTLDAGTFSVDLKNKTFQTEYLNVAYDTHICLFLKIEEMQGLNSLLNRVGKSSFLPPSATAAQIRDCNLALEREGFPPLPDDFSEFLRKVNGFAYNSVEVFGTKAAPFPGESFVLSTVVRGSKAFRSDYGEIVGRDLLCIGREDGDYYTYEPGSGKYQVRSHECIHDIWHEYERFEELFLKGITGFLYPEEPENDDDGRYDAWS